MKIKLTFHRNAMTTVKKVSIDPDFEGEKGRLAGCSQAVNRIA